MVHIGVDRQFDVFLSLRLAKQETKYSSYFSTLTVIVCDIYRFLLTKGNFPLSRN